jgi:hypothetical protein
MEYPDRRIKAIVSFMTSSGIRLGAWECMGQLEMGSHKTNRKKRQGYVVNTISEFIFNTKYKIDACVDYTRPYLAIEIKQLRDAFLDAKKRGVKIRYFTEITKDNLRYCNELISLVGELRHLAGIKGSFYISEQELLHHLI